MTLTPLTPLDGMDIIQNDVHMREVTDFALFSIAYSDEDSAKLIRSALNTDMPQTGHFTTSNDGILQVLGLQRDQVFAFFVAPSQDTTIDAIKGKLDGQAAFATDQSDSWVVVHVDGARSREALERICMIDLSAQNFGLDCVARSTMEHLGVIIMRDKANGFYLFSPRSSADSFAHAVKTSIHNIG